MKQKISILGISLLGMVACREDTSSPQNIDQVLSIYVKNNGGQDLLKPKIKDNYTQVALLDLLAITDQKPVTSSIRMDKDSINYVEYIAGATRLIKDSISPQSKTYYSSMIMRFTKVPDKNPIVTNDTILIEYRWAPEKFEVSKMWHSKKLVFTKTHAESNIVTIVK